MLFASNYAAQGLDCSLIHSEFKIQTGMVNQKYKETFNLNFKVQAEFMCTVSVHHCDHYIDYFL